MHVNSPVTFVEDLGVKTPSSAAFHTGFTAVRCQRLGCRKLGPEVSAASKSPWPVHVEVRWSKVLVTVKAKVKKERKRKPAREKREEEREREGGDTWRPQRGGGE